MAQRIRAIRLRRGQAAGHLEQSRERCHCRRGQHGHAGEARVHARLVRIRALSAVVAVSRFRTIAGWRTVRAVFMACHVMVVARMTDHGRLRGACRGGLVSTDAGHRRQLQPDQAEERQERPCEPALPVPDPVQARGHQLHLTWSVVNLAPAAPDCKGAGPRSSVRPEKKNLRHGMEYPT